MSSTLGHFVIPQRIFLAWMPSINKKCHQNHFLGVVEITGGKLYLEMSDFKKNRYGNDYANNFYAQVPLIFSLPIIGGRPVDSKPNKEGF